VVWDKVLSSKGWEIMEERLGYAPPIFECEFSQEGGDIRAS
jgi:hypothetical protein